MIRFHSPAHLRPALLGATLFVATLAAGLTAAPALAADAFVGRSDAPLRAGPGAGYARAGALAACATVEVTALQGGWAQISHAGGTAWTPARLLSNRACAPRVARTRPAPRASSNASKWDGPMPYLRSY